MSEERTDQTSVSETDSEGAQFELLRVYLKDLSFECPEAPEILWAPGQPEFKLGIRVDRRLQRENHWEVSLQVNIHASADDGTKTYFLFEAIQCGLFRITGYEDKERIQLLKKKSPEALFPFVRELIWMVVGRAGAKAPLISQVALNKIYETINKQKLDETELHAATD